MYQVNVAEGRGINYLLGVIIFLTCVIKDLESKFNDIQYL